MRPCPRQISGVLCQNQSVTELGCWEKFWERGQSNKYDRIDAHNFSCIFRLYRVRWRQVHIAKGNFSTQYSGFLQQASCNSSTCVESVAVGVLRQRVEDEALASLEALLLSPDLATVASRLARMV